MEDIYSFYNKMDDANVLLSFKGKVTPDLLTNILQIVESKMDVLDESPKIKKKIYNILVECLQNLYHHSDMNEEGAESSALFMLRKVGEEYSVTTGNYIAIENVKAMEERLNKINGMDKDELKQYYKEVLNNGQVSDKGGGGLGMIDIARKSGNKIDFNFKPIDDNFSFFSLNIKIAQ